MIEIHPITIIDLVELIGILFSTVMLLIGVATYFKNTRIRQAEALAKLFANFQRDRQAELDNPEILRIRAEAWGIEEDEYRKMSLGSFDINRAFLLFDFQKKRLMDKERYEADVQDMKELFTGKITREYWTKIQHSYTKEFQHFITNQILERKTEN